MKQTTVSTPVNIHHHQQCLHLHLKEDSHDSPFPPTNMEPPSPTTSRTVVLLHSLALFRAKHKICHLPSKCRWFKHLNHKTLHKKQWNSDWPLWEPLNNAIPYKYLRRTYHYTTSFHQWAYTFLKRLKKHITVFTVTAACGNFDMQNRGFTESQVRLRRCNNSSFLIAILLFRIWYIAELGLWQ